MTHHTKEPWHVRELNGDCFISAKKSKDMPYGPEIMGDDYTGYGDEDAKLADARRIVACVNACKGTPTDYLEGYAAVVEKVSGTRSIYENLELAGKIINQHDELIAAMEEVLRITDRKHNAWERAKAAIAAAKGSKQ